MKYEGIPDPGAALSRPRSWRGYRKEIKGVPHRLCTGPGHDVPTWLPETDKYFYARKQGPRVGQFVSRCRLCDNWEVLKSPGESGLVPLATVQPFVIEFVHRIGMAEVARRTGLSPDWVSALYHGKYRGRGLAHVRKRTVRKIMLELISTRRKNEVYHRDDIDSGLHSANRKKPLQPVLHRRDLYKPSGDDEAERGRRRRVA